MDPTSAVADCLARKPALPPLTLSFTISSMGLSSRRRAVVAPSALHFLAERPDSFVASKDGLTVGPRKRRSHGTGSSDDRAGRGFIMQVGPLKVEGVSAVDADACHRVGSRAPER